MRHRPFLVLALLVVGLTAISGCDASDPAPALGGLYVHTEGDGAAVFQLDIPSTTGGAVTLGSRSEVRVTFGENPETFPITGAGTYAPPTLTLTYSFAGETVTMSGPVAADGASFVLDDAEGVSRMTFTRRP